MGECRYKSYSETGVLEKEITNTRVAVVEGTSKEVHIFFSHTVVTLQTCNFLSLKKKTGKTAQSFIFVYSILSDSFHDYNTG
jgi:hypothetical protein